MGDKLKNFFYEWGTGFFSTETDFKSNWWNEYSPVWVEAGGVTNITVNVGIQNITVSIHTVTISTVQNNTISVGEQVINTGIHASTVQTIYNISASVGEQVINVGIHSVTATGEGAGDIQVNVGELAITVNNYSTTISTISNISASASEQVINVGIHSATITTITNSSVSLNELAINTSIHTSTVSIEKNVSSSVNEQVINTVIYTPIITSIHNVTTIQGELSINVGIHSATASGSEATNVTINVNELAVTTNIHTVFATGQDFNLKIPISATISEVVRFGPILHLKFNGDVIDNSGNQVAGTSEYNDATLEHHYKLNGDSTDSEGSLNGTDSNISYVTGKIGNAASFNGTNSMITLGNYNRTGDFTITFWIKMTDATVTANDIFSKYVGTNDRIEVTLTNRQIFFTVSNGTLNDDAISAAGSITDNTWHHVACEYDNANSVGTIYIDGVASGTTSSIANGKFPTSGTLYLGTRQGSDRWFNGLIDDMRINSNDLNLHNIRNIYRQGNGMENVDPGFVTGKLSNCKQFDGQGSRAQITNFIMLDNKRQSLVFWLKTDETSIQAHNAIFSDASQVIGTSIGYFWYYMTNSGALALNAADQVVGEYGSNYTWNSQLTDNNWHHFVFNVDYENKTIELFKDGVSQGTKSMHSGTLPPETNGKTVYIGDYSNGWWHKLQGYLDDFRVYSRLLSTLEVIDLYNGGSGTENLYTENTPRTIKSASISDSSNLSSITKSLAYDSIISEVV